MTRRIAFQAVLAIVGSVMAGDQITTGLVFRQQEPLNLLIALDQWKSFQFTFAGETIHGDPSRTVRRVEGPE